MLAVDQCVTTMVEQRRTALLPSPAHVVTRGGGAALVCHHSKQLVHATELFRDAGSKPGINRVLVHVA